MTPKMAHECIDSRLTNFEVVERTSSEVLLVSWINQCVVMNLALARQMVFVVVEHSK